MLFEYIEYISEKLFNNAFWAGLIIQYLLREGKGGGMAEVRLYFCLPVCALK